MTEQKTCAEGFTPVEALPILPEVADGLEEMIKVRHDIHAHPELGFEEHRTAKIAADLFRAFGCDEVVEGVGRTGVVAVIRGTAPVKGKRPMIGIRADMDALPLTEATGLPYASVIPNRMHACGHDGHVATALAAARAFCRRREHMKGDAVIVIQPGEEGYAGAREMIRDGLFARFPMDEIYGAHGAPELAVGMYGFTRGMSSAAADRFDIEVKGLGGHGARPQRAVDPVVAAGELIGALQTVVSRSVDPMRPAVVSIGSIQGGDPAGVSVIPQSVNLAGTTRCATAEDRDTIERRMNEICAGLSLTTGAKMTLTYTRLYPPLINHDEPYEAAGAIAKETFGAANVNMQHPASMGAEDFSFMLEARPGCFIRVGIRDKDHCANAHHPLYNFNDLVIGPTASLFVKIVEARLAHLAG